MSQNKVKPTIEALRRQNRIAKSQIQHTLAEETLRESEKRYRTMADATPVMIWRSGPDKLCTYFNVGWLEFTGQTPEHELGDGWSAGVHPDDLRQCLDTYISSFEQRKPFVMEYRLRHCSGEYRWILDRGAPLYSLDGTFLGYAGGCIDIHAHKLAEQELRLKQEQLRKTLEFTQAITANMSEAIYTLDTAGLITYVNPATERLSGWSSNELIGRKMHDVIHYKHADGSPFPAEECPVLKVFETGTVSWNQEDIFIRKDGTFLNVTYNCSPIRAEDGAVAGLVAVFRDITAQKGAEERIRRGSEWFKSIIETTQDAVISVNRDGRIVLFNPAAERIFGYTRDEVEGRNVNMLMADVYANEHDHFLDRYERTGEAHAIGRLRTVEARRKSGEVFTIELSVTEIKAHNEIRYSAFIRDISERRRIQSEVETRGRQQAAVAELGRRALAVVDLYVLMNEACILVRQTLGTEFCKVLQLLPDGESFLLVAGIGWQEGLVGKARVPAGAESQAGYTLLAGKTVIVEDLSRETRFSGSALLREHGIVSGMNVIIPGVDRRFGVLGAHTVTRRTFTDDDVHFLEAVATVLCEAIERFRTEEALKSSQEELRALAARLQAAREEERANLAREIHDELSGSLTALKMDISLLPDRAAKDQNLLLEKLNSMTGLIDSTLGQMHAIVTGLRPVVLDKFGLVAAMEWQASEFQQRSGIICESDLPAEELQLDSERSTAIFRIFQEALTNVFRHAGASKVTVVLRREAQGLMLAVHDNGKGIDEKDIHAQSSVGLVGMRERALALGGTMEICRLPQQGTQLIVKIPM
jgi:PAS domain S-box-containing protein